MQSSHQEEEDYRVLDPSLGLMAAERAKEAHQGVCIIMCVMWRQGFCALCTRQSSQQGIMYIKADFIIVMDVGSRMSEAGEAAAHAVVPGEIKLIMRFGS